MIVGKPRAGLIVSEMPSDTVRTCRAVVGASGRIPALRVYLDGDGSGMGMAYLRPVIYDTNGNLVATGDQVGVATGVSPGWVTLPFSVAGGVDVIAAGVYDVGVIAGGVSRVVRLYGDDPGSGVVLGSRSLTVSGNEITDATRALGTQGDGRGYAVVVNGCSNGGFENDTTGWTLDTVNYSVAARSTEQAKFGTHSLKLTKTDSVDQFHEFSVGAVGANTQYTISAYVKVAAFTAVPASNRWLCAYDDANAGGTFVAATGVPTGITGDFVRLSVTVTTSAAPGNLKIRLYGPNGTCYWDGVQAEIGAVANAYVETNGAIASSVQGTPDSSFAFWEPSANLCSAHPVTTDMTGWRALVGGSNTVVFDPLVAKFGAGSIRTTFVTADSGTGAAQITSVAATAGQSYTSSVWALIPVGKTCILQMQWSGVGGIDQVNCAGTGTWARYSVTGVAPAGTTDVGISFTNSSFAAGWSFWFQAAQIEQTTSATPFTTSSRSAARGQASAHLLSEAQGYVAFRVAMPWPSTSSPSFPTLFDWYSADFQNELILVWQSSIQKWELANTRNNQAQVKCDVAQVFAADSHHTIIAAWSDTTLYLSVDGEAFTTVARTAGAGGTALPAMFDIGSRGGTGIFLDGEVFWSVCGSAVPTNAEVAALNALGDTDPVFGDLPAFPTALWTAQTATYVVSITGKLASDAFSDGAAATLDPTFTPLDEDMSVFAEVFPPYAPPVNELEFYYARLPFEKAQAKFAETGPQPRSGITTTATWHGTSFDQERGSFVILQRGAALDVAGLVGERVKITTRGIGVNQRSVYAFVHDVGEIPEVAGHSCGISLPRRSWMALALPSDDTVEVTVEKMR